MTLASPKRSQQRAPSASNGTASRARGGPAGSPPPPPTHKPRLRIAEREGLTELRKLASELSGTDELQQVFEEVLDTAERLFGARRTAVWLWNQAIPALDLRASRNVPPELEGMVRAAAGEVADFAAAFFRAGKVMVYRDLSTSPQVPPAFRAMYAELDIRTLCFVPVIFRDVPFGYLMLYHEVAYAWSDEDVALARSLGDSMATAIGNARLVASVQSLAARLRAIQDLSARLSGIQDVRGIGEAIVAEARALVSYDTIRVYRVDHETGWCEPIAFQGVFMGLENPSPEQLRVQIGRGLTGWVAEHGEALNIGDATADPRRVPVGTDDGPESMLVVPMTFEGRVRGLVVASQRGRDRFSEDDLTTLTIFAGAAGQALVNGERLEQLRLQQAELEHQLVSQRRLMAVNEQLLSTLDPSGVLEMIADSLKTVVAYDSLTIYRIDTERGVRRPVIARDRFAELILDYEAPLGSGLTGWAVDRGEAVLANDAHLDPRSAQIPGTPFEPESMVVVPLMADGAVLGTLNIGRMGNDEAHYSQNEFELTKLFAAQAAIALRNAEAHDEVKVQAERDALTGLRNHGSFQRELSAMLGNGLDRQVAVLMMDLDRFKGFNDRNGHPAGDDLLVAVSRAIEASTRQGDRAYRYGGDEFAVILPDCGRVDAEEVAARIKSSITAIPDDSGGPHVSISVGVACYPDDARDKDSLVETADQALFLAKGAPFRNARDQFVAALDETALGLLDGSRPDELLDAILLRATRLLGVADGYVYLAEPGDTQLTCHVGTGVMAAYVGFKLQIDRGIGGIVYRTGKPFSVDDYDAWDEAAPEFIGKVGACVGVPLTVAGQVIGVIGLASRTTERVFRQPEIDALARFAQLASIALENARLHEQALSPRDPVTGLPSREVLIQRIVDALQAPPVGSEPQPVSVVLLDVDRFQIVNESLGHAVGDRVLREVGERINAVLSVGETVARFGGDTFGVLLPGTDADAAIALAERIQNQLKPPFDLDGRTWFISASMGIGVGAPGSTGAGDILQEAEIALVDTKHDAARRIALFDPLRNRHARERVDVETELRLALERDELLVHYQPILDLRTERIVGFEALARWQHPGRGLVLPVDFIALAEESDLIIALGRTVLEKACRQAQAWRQHWPDENLVMSVNLSPRQFADPDLASGIAEVLRLTGLEPCALELEITESSVMDRSEASLGVLNQLRALGVRVVLDDFGTGYSSLAYLRHLPLDTIKIDRSFVTDLDVQDPNVGIVRAVVSLAHGIGVSVVAEGIETDEQARRLRELGCDMGQGYRWAHPADPMRTAKFVAARIADRLGVVGGDGHGARSARDEHCNPATLRARARRSTPARAGATGTSSAG
ncbi:MAG TPA: EAL domain-containing protein [Candidatus Limnocylindrales bacterium]|nr:EAL domain-containing protein [Candidatus Limnocylindrales bacterium]